MSRILTALVAVLMLSQPLLAETPASGPDPVETLVAGALKLHKQGKTAEAVEQLQQAIALMQKTLQKGLASFFPAAPAGWKAGDIESSAMASATDSGGGSYTQVSRTYTRAADNVTVRISITNSPMLIAAHQAAAQAYANPQMIAAINQSGERKIELVRQEGWFGWIESQEGSAQAFAACKGCMVTANVSNGELATLKRFWGAIDFKGLAASLAGAKSLPPKVEDK